MSGRRAVFLDRDGVLNRVDLRAGKPHPPDRLEDLEVLPGVVEATRALKAAGFVLLVVTNQPDVARGRQRREVVEAMNGRLRDALGVDGFRVCYHDDADRCECRKPRPGLLLAAASEWGIDLAGSFMVGDRWRDVGAGRAAGCPTILVGGGYGETFPDAPDATAGTLAGAAALILSWPAGRGASCPT